MQEWDGVNSNMIMLVHLKEVLTRVLRLGTSGFCLWETLSVVQSSLRPGSGKLPCAQPNDSSWLLIPGLAEGLQDRDALSEEGVGMTDPQEFHTAGGSLVPQGALDDRIGWQS